jgi:hypothetical protein
LRLIADSAAIGCDKKGRLHVPSCEQVNNRAAGWRAALLDGARSALTVLS